MDIQGATQSRSGTWDNYCSSLTSPERSLLICRDTGILNAERRAVGLSLEFNWDHHYQTRVLRKC